MLSTVSAPPRAAGNGYPRRPCGYAATAPNLLCFGRSPKSLGAPKQSQHYVAVMMPWSSRVDRSRMSPLRMRLLTVPSATSSMRATSR